MTRERIRALALVAVAVLAVAFGGTALGGVGGQQALQDGSNASAGGNDTAGNASVNESALPPGVSASGVENASALVAAHEEALSASGYAFTFRQNYSVETGENQSLPPAVADTSAVQNGTVAPGLAPFSVHTETERETPNRTVTTAVDYWGNDSAVAVRSMEGNRTEFRTFQRGVNETSADALGRPSFDAVVTKSRIVMGVLESGEFAVAGTEQAENRTLVSLEATEYGGTLGVAPENVTAYDATVVVDERGLVRSFEFSLASTTRSIPVELRYEFDVTEREVNVTQPGWVSEAFASAGQQISIGTRNETYLTVTNEGDRPLPPGTTVTVARDTGEETVELSEQVEPDATAFLAFPDGNVTLAVGSPPDVDAPPLSGSYEVTVRSPADRVIGQASFTFENVTDGNATDGGGTVGNAMGGDASA
jgi:hypothetical protein